MAVPSHIEPGSAPSVSQISPTEAEELAAQHGLKKVGVRPPLLDYLRETWRCRGFIWTLATARASSRHQNTYLGQLWALLNPVLVAATYFFIFGMLLNTRKGVDNFVGYLTIGIFFFQFMSASLTKGGQAVIGNTGLVRALQFPRVILPLSVLLAEFVDLLPAFGLLVIITLFSGEHPHLSWVLYPAAIVVNLLVNAGLCMMMARIVNSARDMQNLISTIVRLLRYVSGVFFSVAAMTKGHHLLTIVMSYQPFALNLTLAREAMLHQFPVQLVSWVAALLWAVVVCVGGFLIFWHGEESYGRA